MALSARYQPRRPNVINDTIDDEVVIINMASGAYYSLDPIGGLVWQALEAGLSVAQVSEQVQQRYAGAPEAIAAGVEQFVAQLVADGLMGERPADDTAAPGALPAAGGPRQPFMAPVLQKYDDMEDLIMLDPIHEVDDTGWPARKPAAGAG